MAGIYDNDMLTDIREIAELMDEVVTGTETDTLIGVMAAAKILVSLSKQLAEEKNIKTDDDAVRAIVSNAVEDAFEGNI